MAIDWSKYNDNQLAQLAVSFMDEGDMEAAQLVRSKMKGPIKITSPSQEDYARVQGRMAPAALAPLVVLGEGALSAGTGLAQSLLPKSLERKLGITDEKIAANRAYREGLKDVVRNTPVIGAPYAEAMDLGGQLAPELMAGGGAATLAKQTLTKAPKLAKAVQAMATRAPKTTGTAAAATGGAIGGSLQPMTEEDVVNPMLLGAAVPGVMQAAAPVARVAGELSGSLLRRARAAIGDREAAKGIARSNIEKFTQAQLGEAGVPIRQREDFSDVLYKPALHDVQQTAGEAFNSPMISSLQNLSRREMPDLWRTGDDLRAASRWEQMRDVLPGAEQKQAVQEKLAQLQSNTGLANVDPVAIRDLTSDYASYLAGLKNELGDADPQAVKVLDTHYNELARFINQLQDKTAAPTAKEAEQLSRKMQSTIESLRLAADTELERGAITPGGQEALKKAASIARAYHGAAAMDDPALGNWLQEYGDTLARKQMVDAGTKLRGRYEGIETGNVLNLGRDTGSGAVPDLSYAQTAKDLERYGDMLNNKQRDTINAVLEDLRAEGISRGHGTSGAGQFVAEFSGREATPIEAVEPSWFTTGSSFIANKAARRQMPEVIYEATKTPEAWQSFRKQMLLKEALRGLRPGAEDLYKRGLVGGALVTDIEE